METKRSLVSLKNQEILSVNLYYICFFIIGTLSVFYIVIFVIVHAVKWGPHLRFNVPKDEGPTKCKSLNQRILGKLIIGLKNCVNSPFQ